MTEISLPFIVFITLATMLTSVVTSWAIIKRRAEQAEKKAESIELDLATFKLEAAQNLSIAKRHNIDHRYDYDLFD